MTPREQRQAAKEFAAQWLPKNLGDEKQHTHNFWISLLSDVFGVEGAYRRYIDFERKVRLPGGKWGFIDGYIPDTKVLIEQKSRGIQLDKKADQSDGSPLTPAEQGMRYASAMNLSEQPRWIIACNFDRFEIYDQEKKGEPPVTVSLANFEEEFRRLSILVDREAESVSYETTLSVAAGALIGKLYKAILKQYGEQTPEKVRDHSLNVLCVRLAFCLYAEDSGLFGKFGLFHDYLQSFKPEDMREALIALFKALDTPVEERDPYMKPELATFPYVNGGLFQDDDEHRIVIPRFTDEIADILLKEASEGFDWRNISPTIFGAVFESTLNKETQRKGGMHYTSVENIHKVIDPLFLDDLKAEYKSILAYKVTGQRDRALRKFVKKLGTLTFLDPACGSGNFLTETFLSLRRLENDALRLITRGQEAWGVDLDKIISVHIDHFYGIEINDFAVSVAKTALWIAEHQMAQETMDIFNNPDLNFLPLKSYSNIHEGNALRMDWREVVPKEKLNYIMGNPPFVGAKVMSAEQKNDATSVFGKIKIANSLDYVAAWFFIASRFIYKTHIRCALVATNSLTQGEMVAPIWKELTKNVGIKIDFAYRTFEWDSEALTKAHVHCVIIGFSDRNEPSKKVIFSEDGTANYRCYQINGYLIDAPDVYVEKRSKPLFDVHEMDYGSMPNDGGNLILNPEEKDLILKKEPDLEKWIKKFIGSDEFINNKIRYCFWLKDAKPEDVIKSRELSKRVAAVRDLRLNSTAAPTREKSNKPHIFFYCSHPDGDYLIVPSTSSQNRKYVPIGFMHSDTVTSNSANIVKDATLYHFGIVTSIVHMLWLKTVGGRLKSDYRYSGSVVYNTFPWPTPTEKQRAKIEKTAQSILDARANHPKASLADMYGENMFLYTDLVKAHEVNDKAVMAAYGFDPKMSEAEVVAELLKRYQARIDELAKEEAEAKAKAKAEKQAEKERKKAERQAERERQKAARAAERAKERERKKAERLAAKEAAKARKC